MTAGMFLALGWSMIQGVRWDRGYPDNTFLFLPNVRFNDFSDMVLDASRANPYEDPCAPYLPFAWVLFRSVAEVPLNISLIALLSVSLGGLFLLLDDVLKAIVVSPGRRTLLSLLFLCTSYAVLFCLDRANIEILIVLLVACSLHAFDRANYRLGLLCLLPVASCKAYPALFLLLLLRQRKIKSLACALLAIVAIFFFSMPALALPVVTGLASYGHDLTFLSRAYVLENYGLEGSASLWNTYKVGLISAAHFGLISPVDFSFDNSFLHASYFFYSAATTLVLLALAVQICLGEREFLRCALFLLIYLSTATSSGADYRLLYANIAVIVLVVIKTRRPHDLLALILLALVLVPKKEVILGYAGITESGFADVSLQVVLNPLLMLAALGLLFYDSCALVDWQWFRLRLNRLQRALALSITM